MKNIVIRRVVSIHFQLSFPALQVSSKFDEEAVKFVYMPRSLFIYSFVNDIHGGEAIALELGWAMVTFRVW